MDTARGSQGGAWPAAWPATGTEPAGKACQTASLPGLQSLSSRTGSQGDKQQNSRGHVL